MSKYRTWKDIAGEHYNEQDQKYIRSFNFDGGGSYGITKRGRYEIGYIARETKLTIFIANLKLTLSWFKRNLKRRIRK